jgi:hypothetical protein
MAMRGDFGATASIGWLSFRSAKTDGLLGKMTGTDNGGASQMYPSQLAVKARAWDQPGIYAINFK